MRRFTGKLIDGDRVVVERLSGCLDADGKGRMLVHHGGHVQTDCPYCLEWGDGRTVPIRVTCVLASDAMGATVLHFRVDRERVGLGSKLRC